MNKSQKLVQQAFLNNEKEVISRLESIYGESLTGITKKVKVLDSSITQLQKALDSVTDDEIGELALAVLGSKKHLTPEEAQETIKSMIQSKVYQKQYQEALRKQVGGILDNMHEKQYTTVSDYLTGCYEDGFIGTMFDLQSQGIPLCMPIDQQSMVRAVQLDSKISKGLYTRLGEDVTVLKRKITAQISRGVASGLTYREMAQQLAGETRIGYNNAVRIARTEGHRIQCQAGFDACERAQEKGCDVLKQWDATLDGNTRESHAMVDGELRELDKPFSNGLMFPGDPSGAAGEVINCRCALLQRASWELDEDELEELKERAAYFGLDKTASFEEYKQKYLKAAEAPETPPAIKPKKEYLTEKKLQQNITDADGQIQTLQDEFKTKAGGWTYDEVIADYGSLEDFASDSDELAALKSLKKKMDDITAQKSEWQEKLNKKVVVKETKKLKKEQIILQEQLDHFTIDTYSGIWIDDVTTADWQAKKAKIPAKRKYFEDKLAYATDPNEIAKWQGLIDSLDDFDKKGAEYFALQEKLKKSQADLTKLQKNGIIGARNIDDAFSKERKDGAYWFTDRNGGTGAADAVLRPKCGEVWQNATATERASIYEYTQSYHKFNEPLRGIEYGTNKFLGVGNVDLDMIGVNGYGGYKRGQVRKQIDAMTSIIEKSTYDFDIWVQRGCNYGGMDKFFGIDPNDFYLSETELAAKLLGTTPTEYGFMSTGVSKGKGFSSCPIIMNVYAPKGTKMMYAEPFSAFGGSHIGKKWDGITPQSNFGHEAEMILQRGTTFRVTKVEKTNGTIYIDMEVIGQGAH